MPKNIINNSDTLFRLPLFPERSSLATWKKVNRQVYGFSVETAYQKLVQGHEQKWLKRGAIRALNLFHAAAKHVPAYKDFLKKHRLNPNSIESIQDFPNIPVTDKDSYLRKYPLEKLVWYGNLPASQIIVAGSGTYSEPYIWPRHAIADEETFLFHELGLAQQFELKKHSTLALVCFSMGMHIAGTITMQSLLHLNKQGYPLSVMTPGYVTDAILSIIPQLASKYDQILLAGYPPFMKEIVDRGQEKGIKWKNLNLKFLFAAEGFNESWRSYMGELTGADPSRDFISVYGSADTAAMAQESLASIAIRRHLMTRPGAREQLFNDQRLPAFFQYYPEHKYFESRDKELIVTCSAGIPLIRYNLHDNGGLLTQNDLISRYPQIEPTLKQLQAQKQLWNLPFVYVFGRSNQMVVLYGANIYLEHVRQALENKNIRHHVTGKIIMSIILDKQKDQRFRVDVECAAKQTPSQKLTQNIANQIEETLLQLNSEYRDMAGHIGARAKPIIKLNLFNDPKFISKQMKRKWIKPAK